MTVKELRIKTGLSQSKFAEKFHINKGTLANWEQGIRNPPEHVLYMIETILKHEECLDNITKGIIEKKHTDRSFIYSDEVCKAMSNALYLALEVVEDEKDKIKN